MKIYKKINDVALRLITSEGSAEIYIPTDSKYNQIRNYAYGNMIDDNSSLNVELYNENLFYKHNLIIPSNIIRIGNNAFLNANITGKITVPLTCQELGVGAFRGTNISEVVIYSGFTSNNASAYAFANCPNLTKATICEPVSILPSFAFNESTALEEVYLPTTITNLSTSCFYKIYNVKFVKFTGQTPPVISSNTFKYAKTASLLVPYQQFDAYNTTTNLLTFGNPIYGYGEFNTGDTLPSSISGYTIAWYPTLDDAQNSTNSITTCPNSGTMYAVCTPA